MKKFFAAASLFLLAFSITPTTSFAQTVSTSYPYVNPFGEVQSKAPYTSISYGDQVYGEWSFFGIVGSSVESDTKTITYLSVGRQVSVSDFADLEVRIADFRSFSPGGYLHWVNANVQMTKSTAWGTFGVESDVYQPVQGGPFMMLSGATYQTQFGPDDRLSLESRIGRVNYAGWQLDTTVSFSYGPSTIFCRGVYGYDTNVSVGVSVSL